MRRLLRCWSCAAVLANIAHQLLVQCDCGRWNLNLTKKWPKVAKKGQAK